MKRTLYDVLEVHPSASLDILAAAFPIVVRRLEKKREAGDANANGDLAIAREACAVLNDPGKRALYDVTLKTAARDAEAKSRIPTYEPESAFVSWWDTRKTSWLLAGAFLFAFAYFLLGFSNTTDKRKAETELARGGIKNDSGRVGNEARLIDGTVQNDAAAIPHQAQIANRGIGVAELAEARRLRETDARTNATNRVLDLRREEQEARLERQRSIDAGNAARHAQFQRDIEQSRDDARVARERRYYTCLNPSIDLYGLARAEALCSRYR